MVWPYSDIVRKGSGRRSTHVSNTVHHKCLQIHYSKKPNFNSLFPVTRSTLHWQNNAYWKNDGPRKSQKIHGDEAINKNSPKLGGNKKKSAVKRRRLPCKACKEITHSSLLACNRFRNYLPDEQNITDIFPQISHNYASTATKSRFIFP